MDPNHFKLWNASAPIEPEETRYVGEFDYPPTIAAPYLIVIPWENGRYRVFVEKPQLPQSHFDSYIVGGKVSMVRHMGTEPMPKSTLVDCLTDLSAITRLSMDFHIVGMPSNLYILRGLQYANDPTNNMDTLHYWAIETAKWVLQW